MSEDFFNTKIVLQYIPSNQAVGKGLQPFSFEIGKGENKVSLELFSKIAKYAQFGESEGSKFSDILATAMYDGLSDTEKEILNIVEIDTKGLANSKITVEDEDLSLDKLSLLKGIPTDKYLDHLKRLADADFQKRELIKFYDKMDRISGNQPLNEMIDEMRGTSAKASNMHITDIGKLNELRVDSPNFY